MHFKLNIFFTSGSQSVNFVLIWTPSECIDLFVIDYIFVSFTENKYDDLFDLQ